MKVGDVLVVDAQFLTTEQANRAFAAEQLRAWFAEHEPKRPLTETERDDIVYRDKWPVRTYEVTDEITRVDVLGGIGIPIKPKT